ncbi:gibberellin-regulated protein 9 [Phoenix dactylifera]|uniref:Gibberellin-regulated protein 9 n=1 Tax=Phoenix dactylifera TaxID=42345 RepID=A0A8B7BME6_PHODC|nr:gibberellin-regulated protein 9 [Phoenix dactylifera]
MGSGTMKLLLCCLILSLFLQEVAEASIDNSFGFSDIQGNEEVAALYGIRRQPRINCRFACARRCMKASRKNVCTRACGTCCLRCHCVPPGTSGNKNSCPCYARLRTHGHKLKCP